MQPFTQWYTELTEALAAAQSELADAEAAHASALIAAREATAQKAALGKRFAMLSPRQIASALAGRRRGFEQSLDESAGALLRANHACAAARRQIADISQAIEQLRIISPPDDADASEAAA